MSSDRHEALPDTPTRQAVGYDLGLGSWLAGFVPVDTPDEVYEQLLSVYDSIYEDDAFASFMVANDYAMTHRDPDELREFMDRQYESYGEIVDEHDI